MSKKPTHVKEACPRFQYVNSLGRKYDRVNRVVCRVAFSVDPLGPQRQVLVYRFPWSTCGGATEQEAIHAAEKFLS